MACGRNSVSIASQPIRSHYSFRISISIQLYCISSGVLIIWLGLRWWYVSAVLHILSHTLDTNQPYCIHQFLIKFREPSHGSCTDAMVYHVIASDQLWHLQMVSLTRPSKSKQHRTENNRSWLSTCSQVIKPWLLKIQHGKPCHTLSKLDVSLSMMMWLVLNCLIRTDNLCTAYFVIFYAAYETVMAAMQKSSV